MLLFIKRNMAVQIRTYRFYIWFNKYR